MSQEHHPVRRHGRAVTIVGSLALLCIVAGALAWAGVPKEVFLGILGISFMASVMFAMDRMEHH